jgi:hypothetical protein
LDRREGGAVMTLEFTVGINLDGKSNTVAVEAESLR